MWEPLPQMSESLPQMSARFLRCGSRSHRCRHRSHRCRSDFSDVGATPADDRAAPTDVGAISQVWEPFPQTSAPLPQMSERFLRCGSRSHRCRSGSVILGNDAASRFSPPAAWISSCSGKGSSPSSWASGSSNALSRLKHEPGLSRLAHPGRNLAGPSLGSRKRLHASRGRISTRGAASRPHGPSRRARGAASHAAAPRLGWRHAAAFAGPGEFFPSSEIGRRNLPSSDRLRWTTTEPAFPHPLRRSQKSWTSWMLPRPGEVWLAERAGSPG